MTFEVKDKRRFAGELTPKPQPIAEPVTEPPTEQYGISPYKADGSVSHTLQSPYWVANTANPNPPTPEDLLNIFSPPDKVEQLPNGQTNKTWTAPWAKPKPPLFFAAAAVAGTDIKAGTAVSIGSDGKARPVMSDTEAAKHRQLQVDIDRKQFRLGIYRDNWGIVCLRPAHQQLYPWRVCVEHFSRLVEQGINVEAEARKAFIEANEPQKTTLKQALWRGAGVDYETSPHGGLLIAHIKARVEYSSISALLSAAPRRVRFSDIKLFVNERQITAAHFGEHVTGADFFHVRAKYDYKNPQAEISRGRFGNLSWQINYERPDSYGKGTLNYERVEEKLLGIVADKNAKPIVHKSVLDVDGVVLHLKMTENNKYKLLQDLRGWRRAGGINGTTEAYLRTVVQDTYTYGRAVNHHPS